MQPVTLESEEDKAGTIFAFSFLNHYHTLGTYFQAILYNNEDQKSDPLVNDKVLMKFQNMTHPKY